MVDFPMYAFENWVMCNKIVVHCILLNPFYDYNILALSICCWYCTAIASIHADNTNYYVHTHVMWVCKIVDVDKEHFQEMGRIVCTLVKYEIVNLKVVYTAMCLQNINQFSVCISSNRWELDWKSKCVCLCVYLLFIKYILNWSNSQNLLLIDNRLPHFAVWCGENSP